MNLQVKVVDSIISYQWNRILASFILSPSSRFIYKFCRNLRLGLVRFLGAGPRTFLWICLSCNPFDTLVSGAQLPTRNKDPRRTGRRLSEPQHIWPRGRQRSSRYKINVETTYHLESFGLCTHMPILDVVAYAITLVLYGIDIFTPHSFDSFMNRNFVISNHFYRLECKSKFFALT